MYLARKRIQKKCNMLIRNFRVYFEAQVYSIQFYVHLNFSNLLGLLVFSCFFPERILILNIATYSVFFRLNTDTDTSVFENHTRYWILIFSFCTGQVSDKYLLTCNLVKQCSTIPDHPIKFRIQANLRRQSNKTGKFPSFLT